MRKYEMMVILSPEVDDRSISTSLDKFLTVITTEGGTIDNIDIWGRRRMAYQIQHKEEGIYAVVDFTATSATADELDRQLGLNELVLRTKIMRKEGKSAKASKAAARKAEAAKAEVGQAPVSSGTATPAEATDPVIGSTTAVASPPITASSVAAPVATQRPVVPQVGEVS